jgi:hypothetical protein
VVTSDAELSAYRELDDVLGLTEMAIERLADARTGRNGRHALVGLPRESVFGRFAGLPNVIVAVHTSRLACRKAVNLPIFIAGRESFGDCRLANLGLSIKAVHAHPTAGRICRA